MGRITYKGARQILTPLQAPKSTFVIIKRKEEVYHPFKNTNILKSCFSRFYANDYIVMFSQ